MIKKTAVLLLICFALICCTKPDNRTPEQIKTDSLITLKQISQDSIKSFLNYNLDDPKSYEPVQFGELENYGRNYNMLKHRFRTKNRFGALIMVEKNFLLDNHSNVLEMRDK
jgi:hypothetical protein